MKNYIIKFVFILASLFTLNGCLGVFAGATTTAGVVGMQERTVGRGVDDFAIWTKIKNLYVQNNINQLVFNLNIEVIEGRVYLTGRVNDPDVRVDAVRLAWQVSGVKEVVNEIQIDGSNIKSYASDVWILSQLSARLLVAKEVRSVNYSTDCVNGVVYLMGIARNREELGIVTDIASRIKGVKRVVSHVRVAGFGEESSFRK